jgi:hypothetical protein
MSNGYVVIMRTKAAATTTSIPVISMVSLLLVILLLDELLPLMCLVSVNTRGNIVANFENASYQIIKKGYKARTLIALTGVGRGTSVINMDEQSRTGSASPYSFPSPSSRLGSAASKGKLVRSSFRIEEGVLRVWKERQKKEIYH